LALGIILLIQVLNTKIESILGERQLNARDGLFLFLSAVLIAWKNAHYVQAQIKS